MAKYKIKEIMPRSNSFCGLDLTVWERLNSGESVELNRVPPAAQPYLIEQKTKKGKPKKEIK